MSKDISYEFTKNENKKNGRNGYLFATRERELDIPINQYGSYLSNKKKRGKK